MTLVELLAVLGVCVVLLGIGVPAWRALGRGAARDEALRGVLGLLEEARLMAVAEGAPVYFVLKTPDAGGHRAVALYRQPWDRDAAPEPLTGWRPLPEGFAIAEATALEPLTLPTQDEGTQTAVGTGLRHLAFGPTGGLDSPATSPRLMMLRPDGGSEAFSVARFTGRSRVEP